MNLQVVSIRVGVYRPDRVGGCSHPTSSDADPIPAVGHFWVNARGMDAATRHSVRAAAEAHVGSRRLNQSPVPTDGKYNASIIS